MFPKKISIFQTVREHYATLGIGSSNQTIRKYQFNGLMLFGFLLYGYIIVSHFVYISLETNDYMEYVECICLTCGSIINFICFAAIAARRSTLFKSIENIEEIIDGSV